MMHRPFDYTIGWLCLLVALAVSACGPGTGGTGTGPTLETSAPSPALPTVVSYTSASTTASPAFVISAANPASQTVTLQVQGDKLQLIASCLSFSDTALWSTSTGGETSVQGHITTTVNGQTSSQPGTLFLTYPSGQADSTLVSVTLKDTTGKILLGPLNLQRSSTPLALLPNLPSTTATGCGR